VSVSGYQSELQGFVRDNISSSGHAALVEVYHAVREIPYFSSGDRSPYAALKARRGACTAKHIILRDALRIVGFDAVIELVDCDFAAGVPPHSSMSQDLLDQVRAGNIRDIHCWVRTRGDTPQLLDATWPSGLAVYGFSTNSGWTGTGDTYPAVDCVQSISVSEDVLIEKQRLLDDFSDQEKKRRKKFLGALSSWLDSHSVSVGGKNES
jgi:hypothetical protein